MRGPEQRGSVPSRTSVGLETGPTGTGEPGKEQLKQQQVAAGGGHTALSGTCEQELNSGLFSVSPNSPDKNYLVNRYVWSGLGIFEACRILMPGYS